MTRVIEEWPERFTDPYSGITYSDFDRGRLHGGVMVCPNRCWPLLNEKWEAMISEGPTPAGEEFAITTDPTEAPADALLEAAGYYVEPGDRVAAAYDFPISAVARWRESAMWFHNRVWNATGMVPAGKPPCSVCNGTGQVHGALGVGIMWPCECRGGV